MVSPLVKDHTSAPTSRWVGLLKRLNTYTGYSSYYENPAATQKDLILV